MENERDLAQWVVSLWWGRMGDVYVRVYRDAPDWVQQQAASHFGERTTFLLSERIRPNAA